MTDILDPVPHWTHELAQLRSRAAKLGRRRPSPEAPLAEVVEEMLAACASVLQELAGAHGECQKLRAELEKERAAWEHLFDAVPGACVLTDDQGVIVNANRSAGLVLNVNARRLAERQLLLFTEDRTSFGVLLQRLSAGEVPLRASLTLRPRERRPLETDVIVTAGLPNQSGVWLWFFVSRGQSQTGERDDSAATQLIAAPR